MRYLLDVNALLALAHTAHDHHARTEAWVAALPARDRLATCAIAELGFVRIAPQARLAPDVATARDLLAQFLHNPHRQFVRLSDDIGVDALPPWVRQPRQTTDGHLAVLATARRARLATLDEGIPGAVLIP